MWLGEARTPDGMRLYAIGDVHGCDDLLAAAHERIAADLAARPAAEHRIIHVGDYVDRGPNSPAVIERLALLSATDSDVLCLRGNHDALMLGFLSDPAGVGPDWLANGGDKTLAQYRVRSHSWFGTDFDDLGARFAERLPIAHRRFLETLPYSASFGDFFFCHAGIRPGVPLAEQSIDDLTWIRDEFLFDPRDHGVVVVHGHTPVPRPELRANRIDIDTGAVFTGNLTTLVLEGTTFRFL